MHFPTYRQQGLLVARGYPLVTMMCQIYSNAGDPLKGRQLPIMYSDKKHGFFSISGNLGTQYPQAVGWAMASAIKGDSRICMGWIGDGATAEGDFHSAMTFAAVYQAPVILAVVNNQWAISSFSGIAGAEQATFASRAVGYGIAGLRVDGNDALASMPRSNGPASGADQQGPDADRVLHLPRRGPFDLRRPDRLPAKGEAEEWPLGDPIERLKAHLIALGEWDDGADAELDKEIDTTVRAAQKEAEAWASCPSRASTTSRRCSRTSTPTPWHLAEQRDQALDEAREFLGHDPK